MSFTTEEVSAYLSERLDAPTTVGSLFQTFPGMSRETWIVKAQVGEGALAEERDLVIRVNLPSGGIVPLPLKLEWDVYQKLWGTEIPVAEPLWYDEGLPFADGRAHMVRNLVNGSTSVPGIGESGPKGDAFRKRIAFEHAEKLALVHTFDWRAKGLDKILPTPDSAAEAFRHDFEMWVTLWEQHRPAPYPEVTRFLYWLREQIPDTTPRIALVKGNNGIGEEIWKDGKIVAMSDWELASLGDPTQDWAFSQGMLGLADPSETLAHYEEKAGFKLSRRGMAFAQLFIAFKTIACLSNSLKSFIAGEDHRPVPVTLGLGNVKNSIHRLAPLVGMDLVDAADVLSGPRAPSSVYFSKDD